jgi:hypothetical protein
MHAPWHLLLVAAALGVAVPVVVEAFTVAVPSGAAGAIARLVSLAIVPVIAARIAYRQGFDNALAQSNPQD